MLVKAIALVRPAWGGIKLMLWASMMYLLYLLIKNTDFQLLFSSVSWVKFSLLTLVILLLYPLNLFFESKKWQVCLKPFKKVSLADSMKSVLYGHSFHSISPFMAGDFIGRYIPFKDIAFRRFVRSQILSNSVQSATTFFFGLFGLVILFPNYYQTYATHMFIAVGGIVVFGVLVFLGISLTPKYRIIKKQLRPVIRPALEFSLLRYIVFFVQFLLALEIFEIEASLFVQFACVSTVFFVKSLLPAINILGNIGIRESAVMFVFGFVAQQVEPAIAASLLVWIINQILPLLLGSILFLGVKWKI